MPHSKGKFDHLRGGTHEVKKPTTGSKLRSRYGLKNLVTKYKNELSNRRKKKK